MKKYDTATPYTASYLVLRDGDKIAFVLRSNTSWMNDYYGLPSGKVEKAESFTKAAVREGKEESGIDIEPEDLKHVLTMHRMEDNGLEWVDLFFEPKKYKGEPYNAEPHMHSELSWLDSKKLPDNVIPSVRFALEQIEKGNNFCEYGWDKS